MNIKEFFQLHKSVAVAFSGGVDSSVLLLLAGQYAERVTAYYVKSAFQPFFEFEDALETAEQLGIKLNVISVDVLSDSEIVKNPPDRCYYCKKRIFEAIFKKAGEDGFDLVLDGTNASDDVSDRPGFKALIELGVLSPLRECGLTKSDVRKIAKENNLPVADKPSYACLATRIPSGTPITAELLAKTEKAEDSLRRLGFKNFRVRYLGKNAKLELGKAEMKLYSENREKVTAVLSEYYDDVYLDPKERADE